MFLDQVFTLMYYIGFTYSEGMSLPVWQRRWFIERTQKEMARAAESGSDQSRAAHSNSPEQRAMQGNHRATVPSRLRRFS